MRTVRKGDERMLKSIAPMWNRLRHLQRPGMFTHSATDAEQPTLGQTLAKERREAPFLQIWG